MELDGPACDDACECECEHGACHADCSLSYAGDDPLVQIRTPHLACAHTVQRQSDAGIQAHAARSTRCTSRVTSLLHSLALLVTCCSAVGIRSARTQNIDDVDLDQRELNRNTEKSRKRGIEE